MSKVHLRTSRGIACGRWAAGQQIVTTSKPGHVTCRACMNTRIYAAVEAAAAIETTPAEAGTRHQEQP